MTKGTLQTSYEQLLLEKLELQDENERLLTRLSEAFDEIDKLKNSDLLIVIEMVIERGEKFAKQDSDFHVALEILKSKVNS